MINYILNSQPQLIALAVFLVIIAIVWFLFVRSPATNEMVRHKSKVPGQVLGDEPPLHSLEGQRKIVRVIELKHYHQARMLEKYGENWADSWPVTMMIEEYEVSAEMFRLAEVAEMHGTVCKVTTMPGREAL